MTRQSTGFSGRGKLSLWYYDGYASLRICSLHQGEPTGKPWALGADDVSCGSPRVTNIPPGGHIGSGGGCACVGTGTALHFLNSPNILKSL